MRRLTRNARTLAVAGLIALALVLANAMTGSMPGHPMLGKAAAAVVDAAGDCMACGESSKRFVEAACPPLCAGMACALSHGGDAAAMRRGITAMPPAYLCLRARVFPPEPYPPKRNRLI